MRRARVGIVVLFGLLAGAVTASGTFLRVASEVVKSDGRSFAPGLYGDSTGGIYLGWVDGRRAKFDLYLARSRDGGRTWVPGETWVDGAKPADVESIGLNLAEGQDGALHAVWQSTYTEDDIRAMYAVSRDRGVTWSSRRALSAGPGLALDPGIASDRSGHLYLTWFERRPLKEPPPVLMGVKSLGAQEFDVYFSRSADDGKTWIGPVRLNPRPSSPVAYRPQIAYGGQGNVCLAWEEHEAGQQPGIYVAASPDHGATWPVQGLKINQSAHNADSPQLAADRSGHVYVAWNDSRHGAATIYVSTSRDGGRTWPTQDVRVSHTVPGTSPTRSPRLAVSETGRAFVTWLDPRNSPLPGIERLNRSDVFLAWSEDFGATWSDRDTRLNTAPPGGAQALGQQVATDPRGRAVVVAWSDDRAGKSGVYATYSVDGGRTWLRSDLAVAPDVGSDRTTQAPAVAVTPDGAGVIAFEVGRVGPTSTGAAPPRDVRVRRIETRGRQ